MGKKVNIIILFKYKIVFVSDYIKVMIASSQRWKVSVM